MSQSTVLKEDSVSFSGDSQLFSELGERLIPSPEIALSELIKNSYDADSKKCNIWLTSDGEVLHILDDGHGMREEEFRDYWMTIATPHRIREPLSRRYGRDVTGSKGVGRFAVRQLGLELELDSVAQYGEDDYRKLVANIDWSEYESGSDITEVEIQYLIEGDVTEEDEGTKLVISNLREDWSQDRLENVAGEVLDIVSPPFTSDIVEYLEDESEDPGFSVYFSQPGEEGVESSAPKEIWERYVALVEITLEEDSNVIHYTAEIEGLDEPRTYSYNLDENLVGKLEGEIRYFPRRKGVLFGLESVDGREARGWLNEYGGVRVIDRGFRVPPYGDRGNDWLGLSDTEARRLTTWQSPVTKQLFPEGELEIRRADAALSTPQNAQLLGAVSVSSFRPGENIASAPTDRLVPAMDRQGFVENRAFHQLVDLTRGACEIIGVMDQLAKLRRRKEQARQARESVQDTFDEIEDDIAHSDDLSLRQRTEFIDRIESAELKVDEAIQAEREARHAVESMNLLGAVSAFMSHEMSTILDSARKMLRTWNEIPEEQLSEEQADYIETTEEAVQDFEDHLDYANELWSQISTGDEKSFKAKYQVDKVIRQFKTYTDKRYIETENHIPPDLTTPELKVGMYSGIITNIYTNAIKAVLQVPVGDEGRNILFDAENEQGVHKLKIFDNGVGIPQEDEEKIFDPLYSSTEDIEGPTGPGTGLGLFIVREVLESVGGEIELVEPPDEYSTAFEVRFRFE